MKSTLGAGDSIDKSMDQLLNTKADLESYFASEVFARESMDEFWMGLCPNVILWRDSARCQN